MKINKHSKLAIMGLVILALVAATWAYFSSESTIDNDLQTKEYGTETIEKFTPDQEIEPGTTVNKEVGVKNTGDYGVVVRIRLDEAWSRNNVDFVNISSEKDDAFNNAIASAVKDAGGQVTSTQTLKTDGDTTGDETVMYKNLIGLDTTDGWAEGDDGYYYYTKVLGAGEKTPLLFDKLTLAGDTDLGEYEEILKYSTTAIADIEPLEVAYDLALADYKADPDDTTKKADFEAAKTALEDEYAWTTTKPTDEEITYQKNETQVKAGAAGYAGADYKLTIVTQVCQATAEAVDATWAGMDAGVLSGWVLQ